MIFKNILLLFLIPYIFFSLKVKSNRLTNNDNEPLLGNSPIKWDELETNFNQKKNTKVIWESLDSSENELIEKLEEKIGDMEVNKFNFQKKLRSHNRSIVVDKDFLGPDISFLVPLGFKSSKNMMFDFSVRGWNRRPPNSNFFAWNGGDAVGQIFVKLIENEKSSFGLSAGVRSLYEGSGSGGSTRVGEGLSGGFRWDYSLSNNSGIAFGAEQFVQFDDKTDTGRDIYLTFSKGMWLKKNNQYPIIVLTGGLGTGYFALWEKTKFACSNMFDGASVNENKYEELCWGPFGTFSVVLNKKFATFFEYNNYAFMVGGSLNPIKNIRLTFGATLAESYDDYKIKDFNEMRWFSRFSIGI